jgi:FkbM family methyltransferase
VAEFIVPSIVQGTEPGWIEYTGYSSVGFISDNKKKFAPQARYNSPRSRVLKVNTTTIVKEFPKEIINFMKVDVQGAEKKVLIGAFSLLNICCRSKSI